MIALIAAAWACSCGRELRTFPGDGAVVPPMPTLYVTGYAPPADGPFFSSPPLFTLHDVDGERVPVNVTRIGFDVYAVRPNVPLDGPVQFVVWGGVWSSRESTVGVRYTIGPAPSKPRRPSVREVQRVDVPSGGCGCGAYAYVEIALARVAQGSAVGVWVDEGKGFDYTSAPKDIVEVTDGRVVVGTGPCGNSSVPLWGASFPYAGGAYRLGLRVFDLTGRPSRPVEVEVPARQK